MLLGGTGGKEVSEAGLRSESTGELLRNLVLSLGTGFFLSPSPPSLSSSFPLGAACLCPGTGTPLSSFALGCLSLGTGLSLSLGVGLDVSPSLSLTSTGIGTGLSLSNALACPVSSAL